MSIAKRIPGVVAGVAVALGLSTGAGAGTNTTPLSVSATVVADCQVAVTTNLLFGNYDPVTNTTGTATGVISVNCTNGTAGTVTLSQGSNPGSGSTDAVPKRRMANAGSTSFLPYDLYQEAGHVNLWGNTGATGKQVTGNGSAASLSIFGVIPAGQNVPATDYTDSVTVTVTF